MKNYDVIVVGGGASGLISALSLAQKKVKVALLEQNDRVGKKLLATGNGKCNFSNLGASAENYNCPEFTHEVLNKFDSNFTVEYFKQLGLFVRNDLQLLYPLSERANTLLNVLLQNLKLNGVEIINNCKVNKINYNDKNLLSFDTQKGEFFSKFAILACGSRANNAKMNYDILNAKVTKLYPAITYLKADGLKGLNGIRAKVKVSLFCKDKLVAEERGELLFKDSGLSGIVCFRMSSYVARGYAKGEKDYRISIDFLPDFTYDEIVSLIEKSPLQNSLDGIVAMPLIPLIQGKNSRETAKNLKGLTFEVKGLGETSQVICGGYDLEQFEGLKFKGDKRIFVTGEMLDIDGECGGYNLQWAWSSGLYAADEIARKLSND